MASARPCRYPATLPAAADVGADGPKWIVRMLVACLLALVPCGVASAREPADAAEPLLEVFVRDGCPHCDEAKAYLPRFGREHPRLRIVYRPVDRDPVAREDLIRHAREGGVWPPAVPTFVIDGRVLVGFESAERTGPLLTELVAVGDPPRDVVQTHWFGPLSVSRLGLPAFTLALGLIDGFNPCAMWVLLFLLSILVHLQDRVRMALIAGTFVLVSGAIYYAFMAAWLNLFLVVGLSTPLRLALGAVALGIGAVTLKDVLAPSDGYSLAIPEAAKPGIYARVRAIMRAESLSLALVAAAALAIVVNFIELLCTAGIPAVYTAVLAQQDLGAGAHYAYLGLYILGYIADDALMVAIAVVALSSGKLTERAGRVLKLVSGVAMAVLGAILILRPGWLL